MYLSIYVVARKEKPNYIAGTLFSEGTYHMAEKPSLNELIELTTEIVVAHVGSNTLPVEELPALIQDVYRTLNTLGEAPQEAEPPKPAVPVKRSVYPDYIVCLENGKKLKMLKRHLKTSYNMSPEEYREKWGLPADYPMVAPNYAKHRSHLAKEIGLGTKSRKGRGRAK